jgi:hypothetical protein
MLRQIDEFYYYINEIDDTYNNFFKLLKSIVIGKEYNNDDQKIIINTIFENDISSNPKTDNQFKKQIDIQETLTKLFEYIDNHNKKIYNDIINFFIIKDIGFQYCEKKISGIKLETKNFQIQLQLPNARDNINSLIENKINNSGEKIDIKNHLSKCDDKKSFKKFTYIITDNTKYIFIHLKRFIFNNLTNKTYKNNLSIIITENIKLYDNNGILISFKPICTGMHSGAPGHGHYVFATLKYDKSKQQIVFDTIIDDNIVINNKHPRYNATNYTGLYEFDINTSPYLILYQRV